MHIVGERRLLCSSEGSYYLWCLGFVLTMVQRARVVAQYLKFVAFLDGGVEHDVRVALNVPNADGLQLGKLGIYWSAFV